MNRAMRRATEKAKRKYSVIKPEKPLRLSRIEKRRRDFISIDQVIDMLKKGYVDYVGDKPYFFDNLDGCGYELVSALEGWADYWALIKNQYQLDLNIDIFRKIGNCLKYCSPISQSMIQEAEKAVLSQKKVYLQIPEDVLQDKVTIAQIKFEFEKNGVM